MERIPLACSNPFYRYNKLTGAYSRIPCGWCMSCRIDRRNYYRDKFEYAFHKEYDCVGSFTCVTYDDNHIPLNSNGVPTLRKQDSINFIKRLRSYINYHNLDSPVIRKDFKFFCAGEYGGQFDRPHCHFIFVGLDFAYADEVIRACWKNGVIIDNKPILAGGINYVMKYLDKQQHGHELDKYFDADIEPPYSHCSHAFAQGLYDVGDSDTYYWRGVNRPLPIFIKNRRLIRPKKLLSQKVFDFARANHLTYDEADYYLRSANLLNIENNLLFHNEPVERCSPSYTCKQLENRSIFLEKQ